MLLLAFLACRAPVIGLQLLATTTCEGADCRFVGPGVSRPCQCSAPHFVEDEGLVEVERSQWVDDATVVFDLQYGGSVEQCGRDGVIADTPTTIASLDAAPLYRIESDASLTPLAEAPLASEAFDALTFAYDAEGLDARVTELHEVVSRGAMRAEPYDQLIGCCEHVPAGDAWLAVSAASWLMMRGAFGRFGGAARRTGPGR